VRLNRSYLHPGQPLAGSMGSVQMLSGGHVLVGWGPAGFITEYRGEGALLTDTRLPSSLFTYRAYRYPWKAVPHQAPALVAHRHQATNRPILYASWNGATSVTHWRVHTGPTASDLRELGIAKRLGFETVIPLGVRDAYAAIEAVDSRGRSLARSPVVRI
jgi:hypothetical protein